MVAAWNCSLFARVGDYTGDFPCLTQDFNGQTLTVYDQTDL